MSAATVEKPFYKLCRMAFSALFPSDRTRQNTQNFGKAFHNGILLQIDFDNLSLQP